MFDEKILAEAKEAVFGTQPTETEEYLGYITARSYYEKMVEQAESYARGWQKPDKDYALYLHQAFCMPAHNAIADYYSPRARKVLQQCCDNFRNRYEHLIETPVFKAA